MLCEHCKKREATVKYVEVINGVKTEHNLCTQCAAHADLGQFSALFEGEFPLGKLLSGLLGTQETEEEDEKYSGVVCPTCGTTYEEFVKDSRFGCPDCYSVFDPLISDNIRHLQGSEKHVGKRPAGYRSEMEEMNGVGTTGEDPVNIPELSKEEKIRLMETRLKDAVRREEYEEAAKLREAEGNHAAVITVHTIQPIDAQCVTEWAEKCGKVITVEEHSTIGGLGDAVADVLMGKVACKFHKIGVQDQFGQSGKAADVLREYGLTADQIAQEIKKNI